MRCPASGAKDIKSGGGRWVGGSMFFLLANVGGFGVGVGWGGVGGANVSDGREID